MLPKDGKALIRVQKHLGRFYQGGLRDLWHACRVHLRVVSYGPLRWSLTSFKRFSDVRARNLFRVFKGYTLGTR